MPFINTGAFKDIWEALLVAVTDSEKALAASVSPCRLRWTQSLVSGVAAATVADWGFDNGTDFEIKVTSVSIASSLAVVADATNNAVVTVLYDNGAGGAETTLATYGSATTSLTAQTVLSLGVVPAAAVIPAGSRVFANITKGGSGVALGTLTVSIKGTAA